MAFRKANHLTQGEFGEMIGVENSTISEWERGRNKMYPKNRLAVLRLLRKGLKPKQMALPIPKKEIKPIEPAYMTMDLPGVPKSTYSKIAATEAPYKPVNVKLEPGQKYVILAKSKLHAETMYHYIFTE